MSWSLIETEALAKKAARGMGLDWGIAEEAGKATRWLSAAGLPGGAALAGLLHQNDGMTYAALCPDVAETSPWAAPDGPLCPLISGAALCDRAEDLAAGEEIVLADVSFPVLLIPYVVSAADATGTVLAVAWEGVTLTRGPEGTLLDADPEALMSARAQDVRIHRAEPCDGARLRRGYRSEMSQAAASALQAFAHRTYAPDTEESRLAGAGAGLTDND